MWFTPIFADSSIPEPLVIVRSNSTILSQPDIFWNICVYMPLVVYVVVFQTYSSHALVEKIELELLLIIRSRVAMLSHPTLFVNRLL